MHGTIGMMDGRTPRARIRGRGMRQDRSRRAGAAHGSAGGTPDRCINSRFGGTESDYADLLREQAGTTWTVEQRLAALT